MKSPEHVQNVFSTPEDHLSGREGFRTMHENLVVAQAMESLEKYFASLDLETEPDEAEIARLTSSVPAHLRTACTNGLVKYFKLRRKAQICKRVLDANVAWVKENVKGISNDEDAMNFFVSHRIFQEMVQGGLPRGKISCRITGPYLFLSCEDPQDYLRLYAGAPLKYIDNDTPQSEACYVHVRSLNVFEGHSIGTVVLKALVTEFEMQMLVDHEVQHLINHEILALFSGSEQEASSKAMRRIKDEILATIRNATSSEHLTTMPDNYADRFTALTEAHEQREVHEALEALAKFMEKWGYYAVSGSPPPPSRAELVYRLAPIRLADWPRWLELMDRYDEHRWKIDAKRVVR